MTAPDFAATGPTASREKVFSGASDVVVRGSDKKSPADIVAACGLCQQIRPLLLSHIVPKWASQWAKREGRPIGSYESLRVSTKTSDYPKHYLLCEVCEQWLGRAEQYQASLTKGRPEDLAGIRVDLHREDGAVVLSGVEGRLLYRAAAGLMLKSALAPSVLFRQSSLSTNEIRELQDAILHDKYDRSRMTLFATKWVNSTIEGANPRSVLNIGWQRMAGGVLNDVLMGGFSWTFFLGPASGFQNELFPSLSPGDGVPWFLDLGGMPWTLPVAEWTDHRYIAYLMGLDGPSDEEHDHANLDGGMPCPCGIGDRTLAMCCLARWLPARQGEFTAANENEAHSSGSNSESSTCF